MRDIFPGARSSRDRVRAIGSIRTIAAACVPSIPLRQSNCSVEGDAVRSVDGVDDRAHAQIAVGDRGVRSERGRATGIQGREHGTLGGHLDAGALVVEGSERLEQIGCGVGAGLDGEGSLPGGGRPLGEAHRFGGEAAEAVAATGAAVATASIAGAWA